MIQWWQCYDCYTILSIFKETDVFSPLRNGVGLIGYFPIATSVLVVFNQYKYNKTNQCILLYVYEFNQYKYHKTN